MCLNIERDRCEIKAKMKNEKQINVIFEVLKTITRSLPWYNMKTWWKKEEMKWERDWCENEARMMWDKERKESEKVRAWWIDGVFVKTVRWDVSVWKSENVWDWERSQCDGVNVKSDWWDEMVSLSESCKMRAWMVRRRACEKEGQTTKVSSQRPRWDWEREWCGGAPAKKQCQTTMVSFPAPQKRPPPPQMTPHTIDCLRHSLRTPTKPQHTE